MMVNSINVQDIIRRSNRNMLLLAIVGIVIAGIGIATAVPYWSQTLSGPHVMTADEVVNLSPDALPKYNVKITGDETVDAGYEEYTEENGRRTTTDAYYAATFLGDKILLVRRGSPVVETVTEFEGALVAPSGLSREIVDDLLLEEPEIKDSLLPFILDTHADNTPWIIGAVVIAVAVLVALWGLFQFMSRSRNTGNHPIMKALSRFGTDPNITLEQINSEVATSEQKQSFPGLSFTRNWLVYAKGTTFEATRFDDVMWVYPQAVRNKYGTNYYTHLWDRHGRLINVQGSEMQVSQMINAVIGRAPWAIGGYSEDIKKSWNSSRQSFIATVDNRRQQGQ